MSRPVIVASVWAWLAVVAPQALAQEPQAETLTLERTVALTAERNETALSAQARAEAAQARVAQARASFFPSLTVTGAYTHRQEELPRQPRNAQGGPGGHGIARLDLVPAQAFPLYQAAKRDSEAEALDALETRRQLTFQAAEAFLRTLSAQHVAEAAERRLTLARQSLEEARAREQEGRARANTVTRAELEVANAEAQLAQAQGQAQTSRLELGYLLVTPVEGPLAEPEALLTEASRPVDSFAGLAEHARERHPDVLSARLRVEAQEARAREPLAHLFPVLGASYRLNNNNNDKKGPDSTLFTVELTWTLFDGGERFAERRERRSLAQALSLDTMARTRRVEVEVESARVALRTTQASLERSEVAVRLARQNVQETGLLQRKGHTSSLDVPDALLRQYDSEVALARARYAVGTALLDLREAVGLDPLGNER